MIEYSREKLEGVIQVIGKSGWDLVMEDGIVWVDERREYRVDGDMVIGLEAIDWDYELDLELEDGETYEEYYERQDEDGKSEVRGRVWSVLTIEYSCFMENIKESLELEYELE